MHQLLGQNLSRIHLKQAVGLFASLLVIGSVLAGGLVWIGQVLPGLSLLLLLTLSAAIFLRRLIVPAIVHRQGVEDALRQTLKQQELLLKHAGQGIYGLDSEGLISFVNPAAASLLGHTENSMVGRNMHLLIHHHRRDGSAYPQAQCPVYQTLQDGISRQIEDELFWRADGTPLEVAYQVAALREDGRIAGAVILFSDVTERHRHAAELTRWHDMFEHAEWGIAVGDAVGQNLTTMNPAFARMHGYRVDELVGRPFEQLFAPECRTDMENNLCLAHDKGHHVWESWHMRRDGIRFPVQIDVSSVKDAVGQVSYRVVNVQDISESHRARKVLQDRDAALVHAQAQVHMGSWWLDIPRNYLEWTDENYRIFGLPVGSSLTYETFLACVHPDDRDYVHRMWQACMQGEPYDIEHRVVVGNKEKWVRERAELEFFMDGSLWRGVGTTQDITELKQKEMELLRSRQLLRDLAAHHEQIREEERSHIAREIHDELGQALTAIRMDAALLRIQFGKENPELERHATSMTKTIDSTIALVRNVAAALRPAALDMGLVSAAEWLLAGFEERTGIACQLDAPQDDLELDDARATAAFRILQECLTNIARHAQASQVQIVLRHDGQKLSMRISDNGVGFDPSEVRQRKTFGLMGMRERAFMFGGESRIDSQPGDGTTLQLTIPLR